MAYILRKIGNADNIAVNYYEVDTERDMQEIDVANAPMGSRCYIINVGSTYVLNSNKEWKLVLTGGGGSGGIQSDWNQNDETAADYVKNRPFYTGDPVETVLVEESTVAFTEDNGLYAALFPSTFEATIGETYKVYWDGTAYECTCVTVIGELVIGNLSIVGAGSDTGEPFIMGIMNGEGIQIITADTSSSHTFSISRTDVPPVVKIDKKYLVQPDWNQNDETAADYVKNRTHYEESVYIDYVLNMSGTEIAGLSMPEVGGTITVKINGVESAETVKAARSGSFDNYTYIGNVDYDALRRGGNGWLVAAVSGGFIVGFANPDTTISIDTIVIHKIDPKYLPDEARSDWAENDETSPAYIKNRPGGYIAHRLGGSLVFTATGENTLSYTIDASDTECQNVVTYLESLGKKAIGLAVVRDRNISRKFYWEWGSSMYRLFYDEDGTLISYNVLLRDRSGNINDGLVVNCTTINSYVVGEEYTIDFYSIEKVRLGLEYLDETIYSESRAPAHFGSGNYSHVEGYNTTASGESSHAEGFKTIASSSSQHVQGRYNIEDATDTYADIIGNGTGSARSNAATVDWSGNGWFAGTVKIGGTGQDDSAAKELATQEYVDGKVPNNGTTGQVLKKTETGTEWADESGGNLSTAQTITLLTSGWAQSGSGYSQTVNVTGVTASSNGSLRIAQSATDEQFAAWGAAKSRVTAQAAGTLTVKATGTVPTIDIPVEVLIV